MKAQDLGVGANTISGDDPETAAFVEAYRDELIAASSWIRWTGVVLAPQPIAAIAGVRPDMPHVRRIYDAHHQAVDETGEGLNVLWQWSAMWVGHAARDCWIGLVLRYPDLGGGMQIAFNALYDRPLLDAIIAADQFGWTLAQRLTDDSVMRAMACNAEPYKLAQLLGDVDRRATHAERQAPTRPLQKLRPRSQTRRSHRPTGPGGLTPRRRPR